MLNAGDQPPYHFNPHKYPYINGFKLSRADGALTFSNSDMLGLSRGYTAIFQLMYRSLAVSSGKTHPVFLVLGTCQVSTRVEFLRTALIQIDRTTVLPVLSGDLSMLPSATVSGPSIACERGFLDIVALTITFQTTSKTL